VAENISFAVHVARLGIWWFHGSYISHWPGKSAYAILAMVSIHLVSKSLPSTRSRPLSRQNALCLHNKYRLVSPTRDCYWTTEVTSFPRLRTADSSEQWLAGSEFTKKATT